MSDMNHQSGTSGILASSRPRGFAFTESEVEQAALAWLEGLSDMVFAALRDALLPKLISGELRVKNAERLLEVQP